MRILITGARGMLGHDLVSVFSSNFEVIPVDLDDFDITHGDSCLKALEKWQPEITIHSAAYTQVDACEHNVETALNVNGNGAANIARACKKYNSKMIYYSSDYIFDGNTDRSYLESDPPNPLSVYGRSKLEGELQIRKILPESHLIVRTSWLYGVHGKNFVETILNKAFNS